MHTNNRRKNICRRSESINRLLPKNNFEFIITSSNYIFRKPHKRYIGAIDLPYYEDKSFLTITAWDELIRKMEEWGKMTEV